jgi:regulator of protease activity HflC (stomatin/prohibitin superfamily)
MKKLILLILLTSILSSCYRVKPDGDEESVLIEKPYFFGSGGVDVNPVSAGSTWCAVTTDHVEFKITPQNYEEGIQEVMTKDNTPIDLTINLQIEVIKGKTPELLKGFGSRWYQNNIFPFFRSNTRNEFAKFELFELTTKRTIAVSLEQILLTKLQDYVKKNNIPVNIMSVNISGISPPTEVLDETKKTAAQNQQIVTQRSRAEAELSRKQAEINKAIADRAYQIQMGMTTEEYLHLRQLEIEKEKVELIKDKQNVSIIFGGGVQPTYSVGH